MCRDAIHVNCDMDCGKAPQSLQPDAEAHGTSIFSKCKVLKGGLVATITALSGLCLLITAGCIFQHQIRAFLVYFIALVDGMGMWGGVFFAGVYFVLEVLAVPAIPLEMASGAMFGIVPGYMIVAFSSVLAATASFLIARYTARDWVRYLCYMSLLICLSCDMTVSSCMSACTATGVCNFECSVASYIVYSEAVVSMPPGGIMYQSSSAIQSACNTQPKEVS